MVQPITSSENTATQSIKFLTLTGPVSKPFIPVFGPASEEAVAQDSSEDELPSFDIHHSRADSQTSETDI